MSYSFFKRLFAAFLAAFFKLEKVGLENVPAEGAIILCANHASNLDPLILAVPPKRKVSFMAKEELFGVPVVGALLRSFGAFPVKRSARDAGALRKGIEVLKEGGALGIFPEGTRSKTGELGKGLAGTAFFALKTGADVIPVGISSSYRPFSKITVSYGKPVDLSAFKENGQKNASEEATEKIMDGIRALLEQTEEKRGKKGVR